MGRNRHSRRRYRASIPGVTPDLFSLKNRKQDAQRGSRENSSKDNDSNLLSTAPMEQELQRYDDFIEREKGRLGNDPTVRLYVAIRDNDLLGFNAAIKSGANVNATAGDLKASPLHIAAMKGHLDLVKLLLEHHADPSKADKDGNTPLLMADEKVKSYLNNFMVERKLLATVRKTNATILLASNKIEDIVKSNAWTYEQDDPSLNSPNIRHDPSAGAGGVKIHSEFSHLKNSNAPSIYNFSSVGKADRIANCQVRSHFVQTTLLENSEGIIHRVEFISMRNFDHALVVVNRPLSSDRNDPHTWDNAWVVDAWYKDGAVFPAHEFNERIIQIENDSAADYLQQGLALVKKKYDISLMSNEIEPNVIYIEVNDSALSYTVIDPYGEIKKDEIPLENLPILNGEAIPPLEETTKKALYPFILQELSRRGDIAPTFSLSNELDATLLHKNVFMSQLPPKKMARILLDLAKDTFKPQYTIDTIIGYPDHPLLNGALILERDISEWEELIEDGLDVDHRYEELADARLLHFAAHHGNTPLVSLLLRKGADPRVKDKDGNTPLMLAARKNNIDTINLLLENKSTNLFTSNRDGFRAIDFSTMNNNFDISVALIEKNDSRHVQYSDYLHHTRFKNLEPEYNQFCELALEEYGYDIMAKLYIAIADNNRKEVLKLLEQGVDVNASYSDQYNGITALHVAVAYERVEIIHLLLERGANPLAIDDEGRSPFDLASDHNLSNAKKALVRQEREPLHAEIKSFSDPRHVALSKPTETPKKVSKVTINKDANSPSHTKEGSIRSINSFRINALHLAASNGNVESIEIMLQNKMDPNACKETGQTALHVAADEGHSGVVKTLLKHGANPNLLLNGTYTALHIASQKGHLEVVLALLDAGPTNINLSAIGQTPLQLAAANGHHQIVDALLKAGADPTINLGTRPSALSSAEANGHPEVVKILEEHEAKQRTKHPVNNVPGSNSPRIQSLLDQRESRDTDTPNDDRQTPSPK